MAKRTPQQVYDSLIAQGAGPDAARILTEIAGAESGWDDNAQGDVALEDRTWGPSYGLFQIRTEKAETGKGGTRDIAALAGDDQAQAAAALSISQQGTTFTPWTTYKTGRYQDFASQVSSAIGVPSTGMPTAAPQTGAPAAPASDAAPQPFPTFGPSWLPWNWPSDAGNAAAGAAASAFGSIRQIILEAAFGAAGLALVGIGISRLAKPATAKAEAKAEQAAQIAAVAA